MAQYSAESIQSLLDKYRTAKQQTLQGGTPLEKKVESPWEQFAPQKLNFEATKNPLYNVINDKILKGSQEATAIEMVKAANRYNYKQFQDAQAQLKDARNNFVKHDPSRGPNIQYDSGAYNPVAMDNFMTGGFNKKRWGKDGIPEISDIGRGNLNPHAPIVTRVYNGISYQVNAQVADVFQAFLTSLGRMGYKPKSIGGHADRNIAGTNTASLHSYGFAIDVDPQENPVTWNGQNITTLPPGVGALAARYGLVWGGSWQGSKRDTMHFSVAYGGRK